MSWVQHCVSLATKVIIWFLQLHLFELVFLTDQEVENGQGKIPLVYVSAKGETNGTKWGGVITFCTSIYPRNFDCDIFVLPYIPVRKPSLRPNGFPSC